MKLRPNRTGPEEGFLHRPDAAWSEDTSGRELPFSDHQTPLLSALYDSGVAYADAQLAIITIAAPKMTSQDAAFKTPIFSRATTNATMTAMMPINSTIHIVNPSSSGEALIASGNETQAA